MSNTEFYDSAHEAVAGTADGDMILVGGFGAAGPPIEIAQALLDSGARDLAFVSNNAGGGATGSRVYTDHAVIVPGLFGTCFAELAAPIDLPLVNGTSSK